MARAFAKKFYKSSAWKRAREAYIRNCRGLCERCLRRGVVKPGEILHHKVHLTPENIGDPDYTLSFDNLEYVCRDCHAAEHPEIYGVPDRPKPRVCFDQYGNLVSLE